MDARIRRGGKKNRRGRLGRRGADEAIRPKSPMRFYRDKRVAAALDLVARAPSAHKFPQIRQAHDSHLANEYGQLIASKKPPGDTKSRQFQSIGEPEKSAASEAQRLRGK